MKIYNLVPAVLQESGRLSIEMAKDKQKVTLRIFEEIVRSAVIMGINVDAQTAKHNAVESIDFIKKNYPYAHIDDICQAIKMGAYGQLKFEGQLSTLSASNIFQWYKEFRLNHQDKMVSPPPSVPEIKYELDDKMKLEAIRESFINFIKDPRQNEILVDLHYDRLVKIGLEMSKEEKRNMFNEQMQILVDNPPVEFYKDKKHREMVREIQKYWDSLDDKHSYNYALYPNNVMQKKVTFMTKKAACVKYIKSVSEEFLLKRFDELYGG